MEILLLKIILLIILGVSVLKFDILMKFLQKYLFFLNEIVIRDFLFVLQIFLVVFLLK